MEPVKPPTKPANTFGFCPTCGSRVHYRDYKNSRCTVGHAFRTTKELPEKPKR